MAKAIRIAASIVFACFVSLVGFVLVTLAPMGVYTLIYGRQAVDNLTIGVGGVILLWSAFVALAASGTAVFLSIRCYRWLDQRSPDHR